MIEIAEQAGANVVNSDRMSSRKDCKIGLSGRNMEYESYPVLITL